MEETKRCPYCGEEILAVARKCKHCGEWLNESKTFRFADETDNPPSNTLYCRNCKAEISPEAKSCPQCGKEDPMMMKTRNLSGIEIVLAFIIIPTAIFAISFPLGADDSIEWKIGSCIASVIIYILWLTIRVRMISKENNEKEEEYRNFLRSLGKEDKVEIWKKYRNR